MRMSISAYITQKPITKAMCFDLSNTLTKFKWSPGKQLLQRIQKTIKMDEIHGTKIPTISAHLQNKDFEDELTQQFYSTVRLLQTVWPDFGHQNNVNIKLWWKNVIYNILNNINIIQDPFKSLREQSDTLQLITPEDDAIDGFAKTNGIMVNVYDDFPHNHILFNFDEYFHKLYQDFSDPLSYELFPDSRSFINFVFDRYYDSIVMGCVTHDSFDSFDSVLNDLKLNYFDFILTPHIARCSKPSKRFYEIAKINIYESIRSRMMEAEMNKLYGRPTLSPYNRLAQSDVEISEDEKDREYLLHEKEIEEAYALYFETLLGDNDVDTIMVGNSIKKDIIPSLDIGWRAVLLLRSSRYADTNKTMEDYYKELNEEGIAYFGGREWENDIKNRVIVVENLFDIHHSAFLV